MEPMLRRLPLLLCLAASLAVAGCSGHDAVKQDVAGSNGYVGGNLALDYVAVGHRHAPSAVTGKLLDGAPFDVREPVRPGFLWRTVLAQAALSTGDILTVCSFHGRQPSGQPAASLQRAFHAGIAKWLAGVPGPIIFGIDAGPALPEGADPLLGPGPVHHLRHGHSAGNDHLWTTPDLEVVDVQRLSDEAIAAGSDHALLLAELELTA